MFLSHGNFRLCVMTLRLGFTCDLIVLGLMVFVLVWIFALLLCFWVSLIWILFVYLLAMYAYLLLGLYYLA